MRNDLLQLHQMVARGELPIEELPLHLEPALVAALGVHNPAVLEFMNRLELILYTVPIERRPAECIGLLDLVNKFLDNC